MNYTVLMIGKKNSKVTRVNFATYEQALAHFISVRRIYKMGRLYGFVALLCDDDVLHTGAGNGDLDWC